MSLFRARVANQWRVIFGSAATLPTLLIIYANCPLLNYLILVAKSYIWDCRRNLSPPVINAFTLKAKIKYETEKIVCVNNNNVDKFDKRWDLCMGSEPNP